MPKVELHCHLELAIRLSTLRELASNHGFDVNSTGVFESEFLIQKPMGALPEVLHKFLNTRDVIHSEHWMERIAFEACEDMYLKSNVRLIELRYAPSFLLDHHTTMRADQLQEAIQRGVAKAEALYPIAVGLICILQRTKSIQENANWVDFALNHKHGFTALDLADNEVDFDPEPFIPLFTKAKKFGLGITVHAGEPRIPGISKNIFTAINEMGATRVGHGLQAIENPKLIEFLAEKEIPLELCPTSNWLTGATLSYEKHPFTKLYDAGVRVTVNTDDPGIMCTNLLNEYRLLAFHQNTSISIFEQCNDWAYSASFIAQEKKDLVWKSAHSDLGNI